MGGTYCQGFYGSKIKKRENSLCLNTYRLRVLPLYLQVHYTVVRSAVFTGHLVYACVVVALISRNDNSLIMRRELTCNH